MLHAGWRTDARNPHKCESRALKVDGSSSDDGTTRGIETALYNGSFNKFTLSFYLFFLLSAMSSLFSIRQVLLARLIFTEKTDIYIYISALYWLRKAYAESFQRPVERTAVDEHRRKRDRFGVSVFLLPAARRCWRRESIVWAPDGVKCGLVRD